MALKLFPSLIAGDLLHLADEIARLEPFCAGFHIDIMDFHYVPNLTWGPDFVNAIRTTSTKELWVDLLVDTPHAYIERFNFASTDSITVHAESVDVANTLRSIRKRGYHPGLGIDPHTPLQVVYEFVDLIDHVLLMSVKPGFSGQSFIEASIDRLYQLDQIRKERGYTFAIGMDGGIDRHTLPQLKPRPDKVAVGSGIFDTGNPCAELEHLARM